MATSTTTATARTRGLNGHPVPPRGPVISRRVSVPRVLLGAVLVVGLALAGAVVAKQVDTRLPVLATTRAVSAGQVITDGDLAVVRVAAGTGVATMAAGRRAEVVGRTAAVPMVAGSLVTPAQLGAVAWPPAGQAVIALAVKPGHAPSSLTAGSHVRVLVVSTAIAAGAGPDAVAPVTRADATVVSVEAAEDQSGTSVVSLLLFADDATRIASTAGEPSLVQLGADQ